MIVRDEARVIGRCLAACGSLLDAACVCDTGSRDGTPRVLEEAGRALGVSVRVAHHPWRDFGANRTRALEAAREFVAELGWPAQRTWLLLLDADQVLTVDPEFDPASLSRDAYSLQQSSGEDGYWNVRLVRASVAARYVGPTHEYLSLPEGADVGRLESLRVRDHNDGGARADKFERDRALLERALAENPENVRTLFYLARTYRALGDRVRALSLFRRRVEAGGWIEEVWHAWHAMGEILLESGDLDPAREAALGARRALPARAEALHVLARVHRAAGRRRRAAAAAARGLSRPFPAEMALFVDRRPYAWGLREELALTAAGTRHHDAGLDAAESLLREPGIPAALKDRVHAVLPEYVRALEGATHVALRPRVDEPWVPCNPSLVARAGGWLVNCRAVNYRQWDARDYEIRSSDQVVRTRNLLLNLDADFTLRGQREVHGAPPPLRFAQVQGYEDLRLFDTPSGLYALATSVDRHPSGFTGPMLLAPAADGRVLSEFPLRGFREDRVQKNWLPFLGPRGNALVLYGLDPWTVLDLDLETGRCALREERPAPCDLAPWRNSAGPIPLAIEGRTGLLVLAHEVCFVTGMRRRYLHRFVWASDDRSAWRATQPFVFVRPGVEFAAGLCLARGGAEVLLSYGVEDREAWIARLPVAGVVGRLRPLSGHDAPPAASAPDALPP